MSKYTTFDDVPVGVWMTELGVTPIFRMKFRKTSHGYTEYTFSDQPPEKPAYESEWIIKKEALPPFEDWNPDE